MQSSQNVSVTTSTIAISTPGESLTNITDRVRAFVEDARALHGSLSVFIRHTSASLTVQENADPDVLKDLISALKKLAPEGAGWWHQAEGPDDMPAHVKTMLTSCSLTIPVIDGEMALGTWQAIYLIEHRARPHQREIVLQFVGVS
ncbi:MAG: secondary thiamine-phosphate synthase enzyme YjbQ [Pseudomonadota bacterium]